MEYYPDSPAKRDWQAAGLLRVAHVALANPLLPPIANEFAILADSSEPEPIAPGDPYTRLADRLFNEFLAKAIASRDKTLVRLTDNAAIKFGIDVLCTLLSYAPYAYAAYVQAIGHDVDMDEFEHTLRASSNASALFATTDRTRAVTLETDFGLIGLKEPTYEELPFKFARSPLGALRFVPSEHTKALSLLEVAAREKTGQLGLKESHRKCPAYWEVINILWQQAVTIALEGPSLFPRDFALAARGQTTRPEYT